MRPTFGDEIGTGREQVLGEVMRLDARQPERQPVLAERGDRLGVGQQRRAAALVDAPGARRRHVHARIGVDQAAVVTVEEVARSASGRNPAKARQASGNTVRMP